MAINLSAAVETRRTRVVAEVVDLAINLSYAPASSSFFLVAEVVDLAINLSTLTLKLFIFL